MKYRDAIQGNDKNDHINLNTGSAKVFEKEVP